MSSLIGRQLFITVTEFDASEILLGQSMLDFFMVFQQDVEHNRFGLVRDFEPDNLRRVACNQ